MGQCNVATTALVMIIFMLIAAFSTYAEAIVSTERSVTRRERTRGWRRRRAQDEMMPTTRNNESGGNYVYQGPSTIVVNPATDTPGVKSKQGGPPDLDDPDDDGRTIFVITCKDGVKKTINGTIPPPLKGLDPANIAPKLAPSDVCDQNGGVSSGGSGGNAGGSSSGSGGSNSGSGGSGSPAESASGTGSNSSSSGSGSGNGQNSVLASCEAIAAGNGPKDGQSIGYNTTLDIIISDLPLTGILRLMRADLQYNVAPLIADCAGSGGGSGSGSSAASGMGGAGGSASAGNGGAGPGSTSSGSGTVVSNVEFGEVVEDNSGCSPNYDTKASQMSGSCYKTDIPVTVYYVGNDTTGLLTRIQDAIDSHKWNVPGLMETSPVDRGGNGGVSKIIGNQSQKDNKTVSPAAYLSAAAAGLVLLLFAAMLVRRRNRNDMVKHVELDDDDTYLKDMEADSQGSSPNRLARVVGENDSVFSGMNSFKSGDFPMDGYFTNLESRPSHQDVHMCSSATCDVCESRRRAGIQFVPASAPHIKHPPMPPGSPRKYTSDDTVSL